MIKKIIQIIAVFLPWKLKRLLYIKLLKYEIHSSSKIGLSLILSDTLIIKEGAKIGHLNYISNINKMVLNEKCLLGSLNWITGLNKNLKHCFSYNSERKCELVLERESHITSRHILDCNGGIYIGEFSIIAGYRSQFLSHSVDVKLSRQTAGPIRIGKYCFIGTSCILLKGSSLPDYSVLAAGSVLSSPHEDKFTLYAGVPAIPKKELKENEYLFFNRRNAFVN